jgi:hypothetical protein
MAAQGLAQFVDLGALFGADRDDFGEPEIRRDALGERE